MNLADLGRRELTLIYTIALLITGVLLYKFAISPELERYNAVRSRFNSQQQRSLRAVSRRDALLGEYQELRAKADSAQKLLFSKNEAEDFLQMLPRLSKQTGNILTSITPGDSRTVLSKDEENSNEDKELSSSLAEIEEMPVGITIRGKYGDIISLFETLEGFKELMVISDVGVTSVRGSLNEVDTSFLLDVIHTRSDIKAPPDELLVYRKATDQIAEVPEPVEELAKSKAVRPPGQPEIRRETAKQTKDSRREPGELEETARYSVQVGAFNFEENSNAFARLLKSRDYEPWVSPDMVTGKATHHVLVGKFKTKVEADEFGKLLKKELPWVDEYIVKNLDAVLGGNRMVNQPSDKQSKEILEQ